MENKAIVAILAIAILTTVVLPAAFSDKNKMSSEEWNDKDYQEAMEEADEKTIEEDDNEDKQRDDCHDKGGKMKGGECFTTTSSDRDEDDLKDNENEDSCYYEGIRVDNDNSFCG